MRNQHMRYPTPLRNAAEWPVLAGLSTVPIVVHVKKDTECPSNGSSRSTKEGVQLAFNAGVQPQATRPVVVEDLSEITQPARVL